ncbi:Lar family restriction alleviation protein [Serratia liquefaciens]|uniref:Lar family restriction alleviation protein n=1 Tax=Serratia liquefaciens TaxID=614 RepID=UPI003B3AECD6
MATELRPCRVCRRNDELLIIKTAAYVTVFCDRCGSSLSNTGIKPATKEEAIAAWNKLTRDEPREDA